MRCGKTPPATASPASGELEADHANCAAARRQRMKGLRQLHVRLQRLGQLLWQLEFGSHLHWLDPRLGIPFGLRQIAPESPSASASTPPHR